MKIHRPVAQIVIVALQQTFGDGYYADKVLERLFKAQRQLGSRDRKFVAESFYDIVRWWRLLWTALGASEPSLESRDLWRLLGAWLSLQRLDLPDWPELQGLDAARVRERIELAKANPAVGESFPDWLFDLGKTELGASWLSIASQLNREAPVVLRANRLRNTREDLARRLASEGFATHLAPATDDGLILNERKNVFSSKAFQEGLFEVQDGASQQVAPLLDVQPGQRVVDACAGAGGKTLHLAALMKNKGKILALDVAEKKLDQLRKRCSRDGVDIVEIRPIEGAKSIKRLEGTADRLLLDVPCTGLGVLRRNPDSKWKLELGNVQRLRETQAEILESYSSMLKPGGRMVYATCSILPSENELQVQAFLAKHGDRFELVAEKRFLPGQDGYDGFYAAALVKR